MIEEFTRMVRIKSGTNRNNLKLRSVLKNLEEQQLKWFGCVLRMGEERN